MSCGGTEFSARSGPLNGSSFAAEGAIPSEVRDQVGLVGGILLFSFTLLFPRSVANARVEGVTRTHVRARLDDEGLNQMFFDRLVPLM